MKLLKLSGPLVMLVLSLGPIIRADQTHPTHYEAVKNVLAQFTRRVTVLEVGRTSVPYTFSIATAFKAICIGLLAEGGAQQIVQEVKNRHQHNIAVLAPTRVNPVLFETLARCEHFDVVFAHDISANVQYNCSQLVTALINLGDYVFIEAATPQMKEELARRKIPQIGESSELPSLFLSYKPKVGLDIARFTQTYRRVSAVPRYRVISNLHEKWFDKNSLKRPLPWVDGINLITFTMLKGIYPTDAMIRKQIQKIERTHAHHNDLVLGNMIVQGDVLIPIDVDDKRRDADLSRCVSAALKAFKEGNTRLVNPERWIRRYYDSV